MLEDETLVYDQFDILNKSKSFYEKKYSKKEEIIRQNINESPSHFEFPKLTIKESTAIEGPITEFSLKNEKRRKPWT